MHDITTPLPLNTRLLFSVSSSRLRFLFRDSASTRSFALSSACALSVCSLSSDFAATNSALSLTKTCPYQRFFVLSIYFSWHSRSFLPFFFFPSVCVRVLRARHRRSAQRRRGCPRVLAGRGRVARNAVAAFVPRRRLCLKTRGMHERTLSGLHL